MSRRFVRPPYYVKPWPGCDVASGLLLVASAAAWRHWWGLFLLTLGVLAAIPRLLHFGQVVGLCRERARVGMHGVLVYSDSPHWKNYIETHWLPRIGDKLLVLNRSHQQDWNSDNAWVQAYRLIVGSHREYNPAVLLLVGRRIRVFRFYSAFKNAKHNNREGLVMLERRLFSELEELIPISRQLSNR